MDGISRHFHFIIAQQIHVGEIGGKEKVVGLDGGAEQQGTRTPHVHNQL